MLNILLRYEFDILRFETRSSGCSRNTGFSCEAEKYLDRHHVRSHRGQIRRNGAAGVWNREDLSLVRLRAGCR